MSVYYAPEVKLFTGVDQMCVAGHLMGSDGSIGALQAAIAALHESFPTAEVTEINRRGK